ncbi:MAG TPA: tRNA lysidine(34) synthetase TilS [Nitrospira sp.]|nr:tRNA lysidine(34) synthetase TilS [Nitrospira sp.]
MAVRSVRPAKAAFLERVIHAIREQRLFSPGQHLLIAVSGGPDSTALASVLARLAPEWRLQLTAVHINYRLRGTESDEDEASVASFCRDRNLPLRILRLAVTKRPGQSSLQALARETRYDAMKRLAEEIGADRIAVGHTADDQAETMLLWMLRGAGLTGLAGMPSIRGSIIIRPLLSVTRAQVLHYLREERLSYREDSSNATDRYKRNRIRHELMPVLLSLSPKVVTLLQQAAELLREDERYLDQVTREHLSGLIASRGEEGVRIDGRAFARLHPALQRRVLRMLLRNLEDSRKAPSARVVETARRFLLGGRRPVCVPHRSIRLRRQGEWFVIDRGNHPGSGVAGPEQMEVPIAVPSVVSWAGTNTQFHVQLLSRQEAEPFLRAETPNQAVFDADLVGAPLVLRGWRPGDRFRPAGMKGKSKKLQDLFTDLKLPRDKRAAHPVLAAPGGIVWVPGIRRDERFLVRDRSTRCLLVTMIDRGNEKGER